MMTGMGTPSSHSNIPRPIAASSIARRASAIQRSSNNGQEKKFPLAKELEWPRGFQILGLVLLAEFALDEVRLARDGNRLIGSSRRQISDAAIGPMDMRAGAVM